MRNSTLILDSRKLPGDARQLREFLELPSEQLPEISCHLSGRVDVDGSPTVIRVRYKI